MQNSQPVNSQSVKTTEVGSPERGYDGGKSVKGRQRHLVVDTLGLLITVTAFLRLEVKTHLEDSTGRVRDTPATSQ